MSRIDDRILDSTIYLYRNSDDALGGVRAGGTGFLVAIPSEGIPGSSYLYAVTASHVIREGGAGAIRLNSKEEGVVVVNILPNEWLHHPDGDDVAAANVGGLDTDIRFTYLNSPMFLTKELMEELEIGPGDETFTVGRRKARIYRQWATLLARPHRWSAPTKYEGGQRIERNTRIAFPSPISPI